MKFIGNDFLESACVGPQRYLKSMVNAAIYQEIWQYFMLPCGDKLHGDAGFIFQQDLAPAHSTNVNKNWFKDHGVTVIDRPAKSSDLNMIGNRWTVVKRKSRYIRPTMQMTWWHLSKQPVLPLYLQTQTDRLQDNRYCNSCKWRSKQVLKALGVNDLIFWEIKCYIICRTQSPQLRGK